MHAWAFATQFLAPAVQCILYSTWLEITKRQMNPADLYVYIEPLQALFGLRVEELRVGWGVVLA